MAMRTRGIVAALLGLLSVWCVAGAAAASPTAPAPDVLLITVDTLRPDALGWVSGGDVTPQIDSLAREGFAFAGAVSTAPLTLPAHSSLFTGLVPPRHGVRDNGQLLGAAPPLLAEAFAAAGYATAAFVSGYPLSRPFGLARGFEHFDDALSEGEGQWLERRAPDTVGAALEWLNETRRPWFVWVHFYDPHLPYDALGVENPSRDARVAYSSEVAVVDLAIGRLLAGLGDGGNGRRLTVFTADHGESLGEHGEASHGYFVYESTIAVPLVFHYPGILEPGGSDGAPSLVDVAPTILDLAGLAALPGVDGVSLRPTLEGRSQVLAPSYLESFQPWHSYGWSPLRGVRQGDWKWIAAPEPELYRLDEDPQESANLYSENVAQGRALHRALREFLDREPVASATVDDPEVLARLRALGYLGAGSDPTEPPAGLPDPKARLDLRQLLTEGQEHLDAGSPDAALARFDAVLAEEPGNRFALSRSGLALMQLGQIRAAVERLRAALELGPEQAETRALLAEALGRADDWPAAAGEWMEVVRRQPGAARNWSNLGAALGRSGQVQRAVEALARAAELEGTSDRLARLAFAEFAAGRLEDAARHLQEAAVEAGERGFRHAGALGLILARLKRPAEARSWLARAGRDEPEYAEARLALARIEAADGRADEARRALGEALEAAPALRPRAQADPVLAPLLADG
jgi:arylsulfatase A-like enzyme/Flp pilus assembly protein TadD